MDVVNDTGLQIAWLPGKVRPPQDSLTLIVKGSFRLTPGQAAELDADDQPPPTGPAFHDDDPERSPRYETDFAFFKPRADLLLVGTCHAPGGAPRPACRAAFGVGERQKSLAVIGDRYWVDGGRATEPAPFTTMPLRYEQSFGGAGFDANPLGKGAGRIRLADGREAWPLPNIEDPERLIRTPGDCPPAAGFGARAATWAERMTGMGTYDETWQEARWPWYPADFDWGCLNAAPADQQVEGYLKGDEALYFENLHPDHAEYRARLPGLRVRCLLHERADGQSAYREVPMNLDTLWVDMDAERLVLVWRGLTAARSAELEEMHQVLVVTEPLEQAAHAPESYLPRFAAADAEDEAEFEAEPIADLDAGQPNADALDAEVEAEVSAALDQMSDQLQRAGVDPARIKGILFAADPEAAMDGYLAELGIDPADGERAVEAARQKMAATLAEQGADQEIIDGILAKPPAAEPELTAAAAEARLAGGGGFAEADLSGVDLAGADLKGADFKDAILSEAKLAGADLSGADLTGAVLQGADLGAAKLAGARLDDADLSNARLAGADLDRASLANAILDGADLTGAVLTGVTAEGAAFTRAVLADGDLRGGKCDGADFSAAKLDRANFDGASLGEAVLGDASGAEVSMIGADLTELRAGDGCSLPQGRFHRVKAEGSVWVDAELAGADFTEADMARADFTGADLAGGNLHAVDLTGGNLSKASLVSARLTMANLFQGSLQQADLTGADLSGGNFYEAEFWDAVIADADFTRANLKMTKLADLGATGRAG